MAVPSTFADLSTTPATNVALIDGGVATINTIDDHLRSVYALIASVYANSGNGWTSPYLKAASPSYTGTLTGGTGIVNLGSGQFYKDASGNIGVGVIPSALIAGVTARFIAGSTAGPVCSIAYHNDGTYNQRIGMFADSTANLIGWDNSYSSAFNGYVWRVNGAEKIRMDSTGKLGIGTTTPTSLLTVAGDITATGAVYELSDARVKSGVQVIPGALAKLAQVRGVTYGRIDGASQDRQTGVIAQELRAVLPEAVKAQTTGKTPQPTDLLAVNYGSVVGLLIEAIKELNTKVDALHPAVNTIRNPN